MTKDGRRSRIDLGIVIGVLGILLSLYLYEQSIREREPCFITDPVRTEILKSSDVVGVPIKVIRTDGSEIRSDLSSIRYYLWNNGKEPIHANQVLEPISIRLDDPNARLIYPSILKISRGVTGLDVRASPNDPERTLLISFKILEKDDGVTGQIIYEGSPNARLLVSGVIEGARAFRSEEHFKSKSKQAAYIVFAAILGFLLLFLGMTLRNSLRWVKETSKPLRKSRVRIIIVASHIIVFALVGYVFYNRTLETLKSVDEKIVASKVPQQLLP